MSGRPYRIGAGFVTVLLVGIVAITQIANDDPADEPTATSAPPSVEDEAEDLPDTEPPPASPTFVATPDSLSAGESLNARWSAIEIWGNGWVEFAVEADGSGELTLHVRTTNDGITWTLVGTPFLSAEAPVARWSDGSRIAMVFPASTGGFTLATTEDLTTWTTLEIEGVGSPKSEALIGPVERGWFVASTGTTDEEMHTWLVSGDGSVVSLPAPFPSYCCFFVDSTEDGIVVGSAGSGNDELWFTADGETWTQQATPTGERIVGVAGVNGGIAMTTQNTGGSDHTYWRGNSDGTEFVQVDLPPEVTSRVWLSGSHLSGIAQLVDPEGIGRGNAVKPPVPHVTEFDHNGRHFVFDYHGFELDVRVTNLETGAVASSSASFDESGHSNFGVLNDDAYLLSGDNDFAATIPIEVFDAADAVGLQTAAGARGSLGAAFFEERYVLISFDGIEFHGVALDTDGRRPWIEHGSLNGDRALFWFDGQLLVVDLAA